MCYDDDDVVVWIMVDGVGGVYAYDMVVCCVDVWW